MGKFGAPPWLGVLGWNMPTRLRIVKVRNSRDHLINSLIRHLHDAMRHVARLDFVLVTPGDSLNAHCAYRSICTDFLVGGSGREEEVDVESGGRRGLLQDILISLFPFETEQVRGSRGSLPPPWRTLGTAKG